ncbi:hypothetical protein [Henriciella sp.]|uniref:hypothetical protein n=1 Tax=Henriciella sp. TaxID=1968823 RepID=UPI0026235564|nr:hypothetical protein [Henriciella sp.]
MTPIWPLVLAGVLIIGTILLLSAPEVFAGNLAGSDDMMRMQQVRDLIGGQNWYNVDQARLLTPEGGDMHWSRLPDIFLAGIILLAQPLIGREMAEVLAVTLWPLMLLSWALAALATCLRRLKTSLPGQIAGMVFFCASFAIVTLLPGRVDHHGFGIALALTALACLLSPQKSARSAAIAATCVAAMFTLALENVPAATLIIAGFALAWVLRGDGETNRLRVFGAALVVGALIAYVFDTPGAGGIRVVCDAYGQSHFVSLLVTGAGLFTVATFMPSAPRLLLRVVAMLLVTGVVVWSFRAVNSECFALPYSNLSGTVESIWFSAVSESRSLPDMFAGEPASVYFLYGFPVIAFLATLYAWCGSPRADRFNIACLGVGLLAALLLSTWQVRAASLAHALSAISSGYFIGILLGRRAAKDHLPRLSLLAVAILIASLLGWQLPQLLSNSFRQAEPAIANCTSRQAFQPVAAAPRMIAFTPMDLGAPLIFHTRHYATAAPYHRNSAAIQMTVSVFTDPVDTARTKMERTGATHLIYCAGMGELRTYAKHAPEGLAAALEAGNVPPWLTPLTTSQEGMGPVVYTIDYERD